MNLNPSSYYKINSKQPGHTNQSVSVRSDGFVIEQPDHRVSNQLWQFLSTGKADEYYIMAKDSGKCLEVRKSERVPNGSKARSYPLSVSPKSGADEQKWFITPAEDGFFYIISRSKLRDAVSEEPLCVDLDWSKKEPGPDIIAYHKKRAGSRQNQKWAIKEVPNAK